MSTPFKEAEDAAAAAETARQAAADAAAKAATEAAAAKAAADAAAAKPTDDAAKQAAAAAQATADAAKKAADDAQAAVARLEAAGDNKVQVDKAWFDRVKREKAEAEAELRTLKQKAADEQAARDAATEAAKGDFEKAKQIAEDRANAKIKEAEDRAAALAANFLKGTLVTLAGAAGMIDPLDVASFVDLSKISPENAHDEGMAALKTLKEKKPYLFSAPTTTTTAKGPDGAAGPDGQTIIPTEADLANAANLSKKDLKSVPKDEFWSEFRKQFPNVNV